MVETYEPDEITPPNVDDYGKTKEAPGKEFRSLNWVYNQRGWL
jgi:hypothetical protein